MLRLTRKSTRTLVQIFRKAKKSKGFLKSVSVFIELLNLYRLSKFNKQVRDTVSVNLRGFKISTYNISSLIYLYEEIFIDEVYNVGLKSPSPIIIDGGANIGIASLYFKSIYPKAHILAFEPNPEAFALLSQNVDSNRLTDIQLFDLVLTDFTGEQDFFIPKQKGSINGSSFLVKGNESSWRSIKVKTSTLSSLISKGSIDLVKLDIEGDESKVLSDLIKTNAIANVLNLVIEFHGIDHPEVFFLETSKMFYDLGFNSKRVKTSDSTINGKFDLILSFERIE